jgi:A/G-specific adenine glycosylase
MLQQTQAGRVKEKLPLFLDRFPTISSLAAATAADVVVAWQGLGYNNRAVRLRDLARRVREFHGGSIPSDPLSLEELPGIGRYTASAIACFAFGRQVPVVDVNIRRVLSRIFFPLSHPGDVKDDRTIWRLSGEILPRGASRWNQALMDLGSLVCTAGAPDCPACPVRALCVSRPALRGASGRMDRRVQKTEPLYRGVPRRLWRGRIVEILRSRNGRGPLALRSLPEELGMSATGADIAFCRGVLRRLERDGIVQLSGSPSGRKVELCRD